MSVIATKCLLDDLGPNDINGGPVKSSQFHSSLLDNGPITSSKTDSFWSGTSRVDPLATKTLPERLISQFVKVCLILIFKYSRKCIQDSNNFFLLNSKDK